MQFTRTSASFRVVCFIACRNLLCHCGFVVSLLSSVSGRYRSSLGPLVVVCIVVGWSVVAIILNTFFRNYDNNNCAYYYFFVPPQKQKEGEEMPTRTTNIKREILKGQ